MAHEFDLGDCVRLTPTYIADFCERTGLDTFGYVIKLATLKGTVMGVMDNEIRVEWDDGDVGFHEPKDLEVCLDIQAHARV